MAESWRWSSPSPPRCLPRPRSRVAVPPGRRRRRVDRPGATAVRPAHAADRGFLPSTRGGREAIRKDLVRAGYFEPVAVVNFLANPQPADVPAADRRRVGAVLTEGKIAVAFFFTGRAVRATRVRRPRIPVGTRAASRTEEIPPRAAAVDGHPGADALDRGEPAGGTGVVRRGDPAGQHRAGPRSAAGVCPRPDAEPGSRPRPVEGPPADPGAGQPRVPTRAGRSARHRHHPRACGSYQRACR